MFERSHADGIIVIGDIEGGDPGAGHPRRPAPLRGRGTDRTTRRQIPGVSADSAAGTQLAMDHLWQLGHRAIICMFDSRTYDGRLRIDRYERYMRDHGAAEDIRVFVTDQEPAPAYELGQRIFEGLVQRHPATAVYATSDTTAIGLM